MAQPQESTPLLKRKGLSTSVGSPEQTKTCEVPTRGITLAVYLVSAIGLAVFNSLTWKRTLNAFREVDRTKPSLEFFVNQWTVFLYVVMAAAVLAYRWLFTSAITPQQRAFPQRKFVYMGALDAACGVCSAIGGARVAGQIQTLINQSSIPLTMVMTFAFLGTRYARMQYMGAGLIIAAALVAALPTVSQGTSDEHTDGAGLAVYFFSLIPNAFSNVYKEANFKTEGLDVYYLTTYVSMYQVLVGFAFIPLLALPGLGGTPMWAIPQQMMDGWNCFLGRHVEGYMCTDTPAPYTLLLAYVIVNFAYNTFLLLITKHGSAMLLVIASALSLPVTNMTFSLPWLMGKDTEPFSMWTLIGVAGSMVGFLFYSLTPDPTTGEIMPAQGAPGQMLFVTDDFQSEPEKPVRRNSVPSLAQPIPTPTPTKRPMAGSLPRNWTMSDHPSPPEDDDLLP